MANLLELLKNVAKKAGVNPDDEALKPFFATEALGTIEVPEAVQKGIDNSLISITEAKNNYAPLKHHYFAEAFDGLDRRLGELINEAGIDDDDKNELNLERSTPKKVELLIKKVQKLEAKKANADKPDKAAIQKQIDDLHSKLLAADQKDKQREQEFKVKEKNLKLSYQLSGLMGNHKTIYDQLAPEIKNATLQTLINMELQNKNARFDYDEHGNLVLLRNDGTNYFGDNNQQVDPSQFIEQSLSRNKLLVVNQPIKPGQKPADELPPGQQQTITTTDGKRPVGDNPIFQELMQNAQSDFKKNGFVAAS